MIKYLLIGLVLLSGCIANDWSKTDKVLGSAFLGVCLWDAYETNIVLSNPDKYEEQNPLAKTKPQAVAFLAIGMGLVFLIADKNESIRTELLFAGTVLEWGGAGLRDVPRIKFYKD